MLTPYWTISAKSGTAQYSGVIHGVGAVQASSVRFDLTGTVSYNVDFSAQSYTGTMAIKGADGSGGSRDFGSFAITGGSPLGANVGQSNPLGDFASVSENGTFVGQLSNRMFGPDGEEMAGVFSITVGGPKTSLAGVAVAKRN